MWIREEYIKWSDYLLNWNPQAWSELLFDLFAKISLINTKLSDPIITEWWTALDPQEAWRCMLDYIRTEKFIKWLYKAIQDSKNIFPWEKIKVLYAWSWPFASLVIPLLNRLNSEDVNFTLLDIHYQSLECVEKIIKKLWFGDFFSEPLLDDATQYKWNPNEFHIIISETMSAWLRSEPQVAIMKNCRDLLKKNWIFIPELIIINAYLYDGIWKTNSGIRKDLWKILNLWIHSSFLDYAEPVSLDVPCISKGYKLYLWTEIQTYWGYKILEGESMISYSNFIRPIYPKDSWRSLLFEYLIKKYPEFRVILK